MINYTMKKDVLSRRDQDDVKRLIQNSAVGGDGDEGLLTFKKNCSPLEKTM